MGASHNTAQQTITAFGKLTLTESWIVQLFLFCVQLVSFIILKMNTMPVKM